MPRRKKAQDILGAKSIFRIRTTVCKNGKTTGYAGTCTPIDTRGYFLTAAHCVADANQVFIIDKRTKGPGKYKEAHIIKIWQPKELVDIALIYTPSLDLVQRQIFKLSDKMPKDGAIINLCSLPGRGINSQRKWCYGYFNAKDKSSMPMFGVLIPLNDISSSAHFLKNGASGGPCMLRSNGNLVGIYCRGVENVIKKSTLSFMSNNIKKVIYERYSAAERKVIFEQLVKIGSVGIVAIPPFREEILKIIKEQETF